MISVTIETNFDQVIEGIRKRIESAVSDFSAVWDLYRDPIGQMFEETFNAQIDSGGSSWPEHAPSTVARYGPHPLLILTSAMYGSLTGYGEGHYEVVEPLSFTWGTNLPYAATHQYGDPERNIPQREYAFVNEEWRDKFQLIAKDYMVEAIKK